MNSIMKMSNAEKEVFVEQFNGGIIGGIGFSTASMTVLMIGTPCDGFGQGLVVKFHDDGSVWRAVGEGLRSSDDNRRAVWLDGSEVVRPC